MSGRLILVRHGEPVGHGGRCVGHLDTELALAATDSLRRLADSATRAGAAPPRVIIASDLRRAAESARILSREWHREMRFDLRLREMSFGDWEGRAWDDIAASDRAALDAWGADWTRIAPPNGETGHTLAARARAALHDILPQLADSPADVAVVSHAGWIRIATTVLLGEPLTSAFDRTIDYARAAIFRVDSATATLLSWNTDILSDATVRAGGAPQRGPSSDPP